MAHRSQSSSFGNVDNDPSYIPPHYKEYYRIAIDVLAEEGIDAYYRFLAEEQGVDFLSSTEIEHINKHLTKPPIPLDELEFAGGSYDSDSSGTYWPVNTDIAAPALDLGWPNAHMCRGPSDVTIFVHPPAPDTLSIKEEARRLIRSATQVIAIVMDIFTDIDLFDEVLEAACRRIPVYLLLDELFSHHFLDMVKKCKVNLSHIHFLRVRTVAGSTYYCKSGMSFTGNLIERFMLVDCNAVLCGSYSFMWSFEKIHRSIVQRFQGELVAIFDEEFRILFAQSNPLPGVENSMPDMDNYYTVAPYQSFDRQRHKRNLGFMHQEDMLSQHSGYSWAESDPERFPHSFRQDNIHRHTQEGAGIRGYMKQFTHFQQEKIQFDPTASAILRANRMEMNSYKRKSYAEGTLESYDTRENRYERISDHYDQLDARSEHLYREKMHPLEPGMGRERFNSFDSKHLIGGQGILERFRQNRAGMHQYGESVEQPRHRYEPKNYEETYLSGLPHYAPLANYEPCNSSKAIRHGSSDLELVSDGRLGQKIQKRPNIGQSYSCQKSPTQKQVVDPKMLFQESSLGRNSDDQPTKHGLRRWRIGSYLSTYQDEHPDLLEEGIPAPDELLQDSKNPAPFETPLFRDPPQITSYKRLDLYNSKFLKTDLFDSQSLLSDKGNEREVKLAKHESMRSKFNPMLQRGSRLRSSLIFNSSKIEQHILQKGKTNLSIREQIQNEGKESEEMQEPTAAADFQENSSKQVLSNDQTNQIQHLVPANALPSETAKTSESNPKEVFGVKSPDLDMSRQQSDSGLGSCVPDVHSSTLHRARPKVDLQLSKKVQDVINKMTQQTSLSREIKPPPVVQSEKIEKLPLEKSGKIIHSPPVQQSLQLSPQPRPQLSPQPRPQLSPQPRPQLSPQPCPQLSPQPCPQLSPQPCPQLSPQPCPQLSPQPCPQLSPQPCPQLSPQPCPQLSPQPCPQLSPQPCPQLSPQPCPQPSSQPGSQPSPQLGLKCLLQQGVRPSPQPGPQPSQPAAQKNATNPSEILSSSGSTEVHKRPSSTSTLGAIDDSSPKVKLHSSAVCLDTRESKEDEAGGEPGVLNLIPKVSSRLKGFLNLPGDRKSKEMPSNIVSGQPPTSATENEKNLETTPKSDHREAVPSSSEKEEKPRRSPTNPTATKGAQTFQGSRYSTSTSNVLYSSNLRDDTKVILEQISANSQKNRAENAKVQHPTINEVDGPGGSTEHKVSPESDKTDSDKTQQSEVSSMFESLIKNKVKARTSPDQTDPLIKRMESFRKERRVYSRFEVFYKKDDSLKTEDTSPREQSDGTRDSKDIDGGDKKKAGKFIPKIFGTFRRF
ncbi:protein FAM83H [Heptranchias perlo]|uniref:protein FAM83H n=1 Tax=Heptranchias perlo TaxID=212740 RepID=UPI00355966A8